jgi:hypothetical protein
MRRVNGKQVRTKIDTADKITVEMARKQVSRDIGQEIIDGIEAIKTGGGTHHAVAFTPFFPY